MESIISYSDITCIRELNQIYDSQKGIKKAVEELIESTRLDINRLESYIMKCKSQCKIWNKKQIGDIILNENELNEWHAIQQQLHDYQNQKYV